MVRCKRRQGCEFGDWRAGAVFGHPKNRYARKRRVGARFSLTIALCLIWGPAAAQSSWIDQARQTLGGLVDRFSPSTPPRHKRPAVVRPSVKSPLPPQKPRQLDALRPATPAKPGIAPPLRPAAGPQATMFAPLKTPPPPGKTVVLTPSGFSGGEILAGPVPPIVGTAFLKNEVLAPPPTIKPPPPEPSSGRNVRLSALPPRTSGTCGDIAAFAARYVEKPAIRNGACVVDRPVLLQSVGGAGLRIAPSATVNCNLTAALATWAETVVAPAARRHLGVPVVSVRNMASYACRRRNNSKNGRISEHAFANALDVGSFKLADGGEVTVLKDWNGGGARQAFLREVHAKSCGVFKTVLGPNSDRFHATHIHLDLAKRRSTYCR